MDSLTQITLGAAVGEAVLGKKIGNKAMIWGAIAGTLPDLDVFANLAADEISALAFHRAITHSIFFAVLAPLALGWLTYRLYREGPRRSWWTQCLYCCLFLIVACLIGTVVMPIPFAAGVSIAVAVGFSMIALPALVGLFRLLRKKDALVEPPGPQAWMLLFFWAILTHPLLDACTTYGTQLWRPFSDQRVALYNISVVDPVYTLPFLLCVLTAALLKKGSKARFWINTSGLIISCAYLLFTFYNKRQVDQVFARSLDQAGVVYERLITSPTIFNNVLWQGAAENDTAFFTGLYSILDREAKIPSFQTVLKNHHLIKGHEEDRDVAILRWFSDGYYALEQAENDQIYFYDLRFGSLPGKEEKKPIFIFKFVLKAEEQGGELKARQSTEPPETDGAFQSLWERLQGR